MTTPHTALVEAARAALECFDDPAEHFPHREWDRRVSQLRAALAQAEAAQPQKPICWASPMLAEPDDEDEAQGWEARVKSGRSAAFSMPLYAAPQPAEAAPKQPPTPLQIAARLVAEATPEMLPLAVDALRDHLTEAAPRQPLTLDQIDALEAGCGHTTLAWDTRVSLVRATERAHGIGPAWTPKTPGQIAQEARDAVDARWCAEQRKKDQV